GVDDLVLVARHDAPPGSRTSLGTFPFSVNTRRIALWPKSAVGPNMHGQPPSITLTPWPRPYSAAASETLPAPGPRCLQTCLMPRFTHSRLVSSAIPGLVPITIASTPLGIEARLWYARSPSRSLALALAAKTLHPRAR